MRFITSALLTTGLVASQVGATGWTNQPAFSCPSTSNNDCNAQQKSGFDWTSLQIGDFGSYGDFGFSGYKCANSFGKRDPLTKRTFQSKCISGKLPAGGGQGPSFDCGSKKSGFSIDKYQVSVDKDTNVEFHYKMDDGSTCKHVSPCQAGGSVVQNTQCGGAKQVTVQLPKESKQDCNIGIHSIGFKCDSASSSSIVSKSTSVPVVIKSSASSSVPATSTPSVVIKSSSEYKSSSTVSSVIKVSTLTPATSTATSTISSVVRFTSTVPSSTPETSNKALSTSSSYSMPVVSSKPVYLNSTTWSSSTIKAESPSSSIRIILSTASSSWTSSWTSTPSFSLVIKSSSSVESTSNAPLTPSSSSSSSTWSSTYSPSVSSSTPVSSDKGVVPSSSTWTSTYSSSSVSSVTKSIAPSPQPSAACPDVLPKCLNTWLHNTGCKDNSDYTCFCDKPDFTKNVMDCVSAWAMDDSETQKGLSYLAGICAAYVPKNPGLITNCPKTITIGVPPSSPVIKASSNAPLSPSPTPTYAPVMNVTSSVLVDITTVIATSYTTTCPAGQPVTNDKGQVTTHTTPVVSTVFSTTVKTICTKCTRVPVVSNKAETPLVDVTTVIATSYVTTCPAGQPHTKDNGEVTTYSTPVTSTIFTTTTSTVCTKCTRVPAMPTGNAGVATTSAVVTPVSTVQADIPVTTITIKATYTAQCTYSTGESAGFPIPGSSTATFVDTTIVAPQVAFATATPVQGNIANAGEATTAPASVDLVAAATPAPVPANAATDAPVAAAATTDAESYASMKTMASVNAGQATATSSKVAQFTGAAVANKAFGGLVAVAAGAAALLI